MLGQLYWDGGTHRGAEHPLQHLDNLVSDLNKSFFPHQKSYHSTTYFFRRRELWIWFVDPFIVRDHRPGAYDECALVQLQSTIFFHFPPGVVIIEDGSWGCEKEDRLQNRHPQPGGEKAPRQWAGLREIFYFNVICGYFTLFRKACWHRQLKVESLSGFFSWSNNLISWNAP